MENIGYVGLSLQKSLKQQMEVVSNNIANVSTPGYKSKSVIFEEYMNMSNPGQRRDVLSQVLDKGTWRNTEQGTLSMTGNPLDMALMGDGYFAVDTPQGVQYTRAGNFTLNNDRQIVTAQGFPVLNANNQPITIPENDMDIMVTPTGSISTETGNVDQLKLVRFENDQNLQETGNGFYAADEAGELPVDERFSVTQGAIEGSNVQPVLEMTKMIEVLRSYQAAQRMLQNDHDRIRQSIRTLGEVGGQ